MDMRTAQLDLSNIEHALLGKKILRPKGMELPTNTTQKLYWALGVGVVVFGISLLSLWFKQPDMTMYSDTKVLNTGTTATSTGFCWMKASGYSLLFGASSGVVVFLVEYFLIK